MQFSWARGTAVGARSADSKPVTIARLTITMPRIMALLLTRLLNTTQLIAGFLTLSTTPVCLGGIVRCEHPFGGAYVYLVRGPRRTF